MRVCGVVEGVMPVVSHAESPILIVGVGIPGPKFSPDISTSVCPAAGPVLGVMLLTTGAIHKG